MKWGSFGRGLSFLRPRWFNGQQYNLRMLRKLSNITHIDLARYYPS